MASVKSQHDDDAEPKHDENSRVLVDRLDELLAQYLNILDQYQTTRADLSKHFSNGFMNLAQANFASRSRFGQDFYDDRLQTSKKVSIQADNAIMEYRLDNVDDIEAETMPDKKHSVDPIRMFGLFVPTPLRSAQTQFSTAVSGPMVALLNLDNKMNALEIEVRRTKKQLSKIARR